MQRFGKDSSASFEKYADAATDQTTALLRAEAATARHEITEEIAVANRATHDALVAMLKGLKK